MTNVARSTEKYKAMTRTSPHVKIVLSPQVQAALELQECVIYYRLQQRTGTKKNCNFRDVMLTRDYWAMRDHRLKVLRNYPKHDIRVIKETYLPKLTLAKTEVLK